MAEGYLTTHVLDTARGVPAAGLRIALYDLRGSGHRKITEMVTNADGRTDAQILPKDAFAPGVYELVFYAGEYLDRTGVAPESPRDLEVRIDTLQRKIATLEADSKNRQTFRGLEELQNLYAEQIGRASCRERVCHEV